MIVMIPVYNKKLQARNMQYNIKYYKSIKNSHTGRTAVPEIIFISLKAWMKVNFLTSKMPLHTNKNKRNSEIISFNQTEQQYLNPNNIITLFAKRTLNPKLKQQHNISLQEPQTRYLIIANISNT